MVKELPVWIGALETGERNNFIWLDGTPVVWRDAFSPSHGSNSFASLVHLTKNFSGVCPDDDSVPRNTFGQKFWAVSGQKFTESLYPENAQILARKAGGFLLKTACFSGQKLVVSSKGSGQIFWRRVQLQSWPERGHTIHSTAENEEKILTRTWLDIDTDIDFWSTGRFLARYWAGVFLEMGPDDERYWPYHSPPLRRCFVVVSVKADLLTHTNLLTHATWKPSESEEK
ncbi:unnamed protein product, partial [Cyprideis torosa]